MPNQGFGICGHKNAYSSGTYCGNWVEDSFGAESQSAGSVPDAMTSETMRNYGPPGSNGANGATTNTAEGLSRDLLLSHSNHKQRYETAYEAATGKARKGDELAKSRRKRADKEYHTSVYSTELSRSSASPFLPQAMAKNTR